MRERTERQSGQSMVEMALILPFLLFLTLGIIDMGWYIFGYATIYQAARNGAEKAAEIPPFTTRISPLQRNDICVSTIIDATLDGTPNLFFSDLTSGANGNVFTISYPNGGKRALGEPLQIDISYQLRPLTPFWRFVTFGNKGTMTVTTATRRTIESLGDNPNSPNGIACN